MAETHDCKRLFWHSTRLKKGTPVFHRAPTRETDYPFRVSNSVVVKLPFGRGVVLGWWRPSGLDEYEALIQAVRMNHELDDQDAANFTNPDVTASHSGISRWGRRRMADPVDDGSDK